MYKVVIIDDEELIRDGLKNVVPWNDLGCEIAAEASNGIEGIEVIKRVHPDIILTDIKMQGADGLTMLEKTINIAENAKILIITGYRDFDYARKAIRLGAFDYLVKPTSMDSLISCIKAMTRELDKTRDSSASYIDQTIMNEYHRHPKLMTVNIAKSKLIDAICMGDEEESKTLYSEYRKVCMNTFSSKPMIMAAIYQFILDLNSLRPNIKLEEYTEFSGLNSLMSKKGNIDELFDIVWWAAEKTVNEYNERFDSAKSIAVKKMKEYIVKNYDRDIGLTEIAASAHISTYYASKIFKNETGINLIEYLNYYRIEQAKNLLRDSEYKVYEIAEKVGIWDSHYFSRIFKKSTNYTPREYRDIYLQSHGED